LLKARRPSSPPLRDAAPGATSADVPGAGHFLVHETPDRVLAEINAFYPAA
jgi:pimeloyl-ACP methyl ester carboxylesterase